MLSIVANALDEAWRAGQAAWPGIELTLESFIAFVRDPEGVSRFPADLYLAAACVDGNRSASDAFEREVLPAATAAIQSIDPARAFVDEALQQLRAGLFVGNGMPKLAHYTGRGPLRAWVGVSAARVALMMMRSQKRQREVSLEDDEWTHTLAAISTANPELELLKQQYAAAFSGALRDAIAALEPRLRAVLRMSFVDGASIDEIGTVYNVHRATAARWVQRACDEVQDRTRELLAERLALSATELDRMTALVRSQLDVSLSQLLPVTARP
jgi:RNA polymerase sigma-70 factor (ECF subfamily)